MVSKLKAENRKDANKASLMYKTIQYINSWPEKQPSLAVSFKRTAFPSAQTYSLVHNLHCGIPSLLLAGERSKEGVSVMHLLHVICCCYFYTRELHTSLNQQAFFSKTCAGYFPSSYWIYCPYGLGLVC